MKLHEKIINFIKTAWRKTASFFKAVWCKTVQFVKAHTKLVIICALSLVVVVSAGLGIGFGVASCNKNKNNPSSSVGGTDDQLSYVYRVSLQNTTGFGFDGVTINLMKGDTVVASKTTNSSGNANFFEDEITAGEYTVQVENIPAGYAFEHPDLTYKTSKDAGTATTVTILPTGILSGEAPSGTRYSLGDVVYDFSFTLPTGQTYTLSEVLKEKDMVFLNFWATWCGPCISEFPSMHNAAIAYSDTVSVLAVSVSDSSDAVRNFQFTENNYSQFNMASSGSGNLSNLFGVTGGSNATVPHSFIIDRYGVVTFDEVGSMPSVSAFTSQFDKFVGEDYVPLVVGKTTDNEGEGGEGGGIELIKPTVTAPKVEDLKTAFTENSASGFTFRYQERTDLTPDEEDYDAYNWPWSIGNDDGNYIYASNANVHGSWAILYSTMTAKAGDVLAFDYKVGSEENCDILYIILDGMYVQSYSGAYNDKWYTSYAYVFNEDEVGEHEISFVFRKDSDTTYNADEIKLRNLRLMNVSQLTGPEVDANIFRNAATVLNTDKDAKTQFKKYITPVYNEEDEYYHVGEKNGPVLYANMMLASPWNETSVWELAYNDYIIGDGINYRPMLENYAWEASQTTSVQNYTPVTEDLRLLLDVAVKYNSYLEKWEGKYYGENEWKDYHEQEWLELCVYWEHYGDTPLPSDPMAGFTFTAAIDLHSSEENCTHSGNCTCANFVSVPTLLNPRGFKYKFIPEKSGAYKVYSTGTANSQVFLMDGDRETTLGFWDDKVFESTYLDENNVEVSDGNFEFYWYFEAGETYYLLFATYMDDPAKYDVYLDYIDESYTYLENAAVGPYSVNLNTFELFLPDAIAYTYYDDTDDGIDNGFYYHKLADGSRGGQIYLDVNRPTAFFNIAMSLYEICRQGVTVKDETKRALYIPEYGDLTEEMYKVCYEATGGVETDPKYGFIAVDKDLFDLLNKIVCSSKYDGIHNSWLLLCYYDRTVSADNQ